MYKYEKIKQQINQYEYISFDMFDTLIKRNIDKPTDLFDLIEKEYNKNNKQKIKKFKDIRISCERKAREITEGGEPNINDIYNVMKLKNKDKIKKLEIQLEMQICEQNIDFYNIYKYARDKKKKIIITSDMYLTKDIIEKILNDANIKYDYIFLSNNVKLNKHNGKVYSYILDKLHISSKQLLHIGDSKRADYLTPKILGIKSILIPKQNIKLKYYDDYSFNTLDENIIINFINNNILFNEDVYYKLGYEILGIILLGYSKWLKEQLKNREIKKVFFLAREGALLKKAFDLINDTNIETKYLYVSRRSTQSTLLKKVSTLKDLFKICKMRKVVDLESLFIKVGLDINNYNNLLNKYKVKKEDNIKTIYNLEEIFSEIKEDIIKNSQEEEKNLLQYLKQEDFKGKLAIADIGWAGTMQKSLSTITAQNKIDIDITGFYVGELQSAYDNIKMGNKQYAYLFDYKNDERKFKSFLGLFENLFSSNHGTTIKYEKTGKIVKPILSEYEYSEKESEIFLHIQKGAIDFIKEINCIESLDLKISNKFALYGINKLGSHPTLNDVKNFGKIPYLDTKKVDLANPKHTLIYYICKPKELVSDFLKSGWKAGFIKKIFNVNLPYYKFLK